MPKQGLAEMKLSGDAADGDSGMFDSQNDSSALKIGEPEPV